MAQGKKVKMLTVYLPAMNARWLHLGRIYTPGTWTPPDRFYSITGLPGIIGLPYLTIEAWNDGTGVIAYRILPDRKVIAALLLMTEIIYQGIGAVQTRFQGEAIQACPTLIFGIPI